MTDVQTRTPAGARMFRGHRRFNRERVEIDRWRITDSTPEQAEVVGALADAATRLCFALPARPD